MDPNERRGWTEIVTADDLDLHMASIGQAQANAEIIVNMFRDFPLEVRARLLVPGSGTGQMFDYIRPHQIGPYQFTFTDLRQEFLDRLKARLSRFGNIEYNMLQDDIEKTKLSGIYDGILMVLVLLHVEWNKALEQMLGLNPSRFYIIEQEQKSNSHAVARERELTPSIRQYSEIANPALVPRQELTDYLERSGYRLLKIYEKPVPDQKTMVGLVFERRN